MTEENKLIIDGKDYGNDYTAYCRAYNNRLREMFRMTQLKDIPRLQSKRRVIRSHNTHDFTPTKTNIHTILSYVLAYLLGTILFIYGFIALLLT